MSGFDKLDAAMAAHKSQQADSKAVEKARDRFLTEYDVFAQTEASQMFQLVGNKLREGGHDFHYAYDQESYTMTLDVFIDSTRADHVYGPAGPKHPKVTMRPAPVNHKVVCYVDRTQGGSTQSGVEGREYSLDEVSVHVVSDIVANVFSDSST